MVDLTFNHQKLGFNHQKLGFNHQKLGFSMDLTIKNWDFNHLMDNSRRFQDFFTGNHWFLPEIL